MKNLKTYHQLFENTQELTPEQIELLDECTKGTWTPNPETGEVDVDGNFDCYRQGLTDFKGVRFGVVGQNFRCDNNHLTTLEGSPREVGGDFYCQNNQLTSLEGAPQEVGGDFSCANNQITSLEGAPQKVGGDFFCYGNLLTTLEGAPQVVGGGFDCDTNQLTSLEGAPKEVGGGFRCEYNQLTTLEGAPQKVGKNFDCDNNAVSEETLNSIFFRMKKGDSYLSIFFRMKKGDIYLQAVETLWKRIPLEDQILLYRPEFEWVSPEEKRKLEALKAYQGFKGMI
jgi:hypothetical protein